MNFYFTFGQKYRREPHPCGGHPDGWFRVIADSLEDATRKMQAESGRFESATLKFLDHRQGPPLGTFQDVQDGKNIFANLPPKPEYISVTDFAFPKGGV